MIYLSTHRDVVLSWEADAIHCARIVDPRKGIPNDTPHKVEQKTREDSGVATPRKSSLGAGHLKDDTPSKTKMFRFRLLLPNGTSLDLKMSELRKEMPI
ncbi:hypothetical protein OROMI_007214 [Orobanche minor]